MQGPILCLGFVLMCASFWCSGVPDWGDSPSWQPSSSANLDDEAVSQQLQEQFNREVGGGASSGFGLSLEDESLAVARMLQVWASLAPASAEATLLDCTYTNSTMLHPNMQHVRHSLV